MSSFTKPLTVTKLSARKWRVERSFTYHVGAEDSNMYVLVESGFETDFASVPRAFWWLFPPDGKYTQAAVVHDLLYREKRVRENVGIVTKKEPIDRAMADAIFMEGMKVLKVPRVTRTMMWGAVRAFGWMVWRN